MVTELIAIVKTALRIVKFLSSADSAFVSKLITSTLKSMGLAPTMKNINALTKFAENVLNRQKVKFLNSLDRQVKKLSPIDVKKFNKWISSVDGDVNKPVTIQPDAKQGIQGVGQAQFVLSSWIDWIMWKPKSKDNIYGTLWIRVKTASFTNPLGIYQFPKHGHPHGYGPYVHKKVYLSMLWALGAGSVFWALFYRQWYYAHRGIGYGLTYRKNRYYIGRSNKRYYVPR